MSEIVAEDGEKKRSVSEMEPETATNTQQKRVKASKPPRRKYKNKQPEQTSPMGVLNFEINEIIIEQNLTKEQITNDMRSILNDVAKFNIYHRVVSNVEIIKLSSHGDGIALISHPELPGGSQIALVPFSFPGDIVTVKVFKTHPLYVESDLMGITKSGDLRDDSIIRCRYFGKCSGCQYQNVEYSNQLMFKQQTISNAYKFFAPQLTKLEKLPQILDTEASPLQYGYRTKLTPHFDLPKKLPPVEERKKPALGFGSKNKNQWREHIDGGDYSVLDIEECIIGTGIINMGMKNERDRYDKEFLEYKKGATILLRENTILKDGQVGEGSTDANGDVTKLEVQINDATEKILIKTCVTNPRQIVNEYINGYVFEFSAGEFFQNNNSILPLITSYVQSNLKIDDNVNYLVDTYCGSGLFSITCSKSVDKVIGVEVSADSVKFARRNAEINNVTNTKFIHGKAEQIFGEIDTPAAQTSVILDPPRKGCDEVFLKQLSEYNPAKIVYISCNVHSQARDIEWFINHSENGDKYKIDSVKGFDFFPQTHHVESVAVLSLK